MHVEGYTIRLGEKSIPWGPSFRLFMTTKLPNPKLSVDIFVKTTVINFAITPEGCSALTWSWVWTPGFWGDCSDFLVDRRTSVNSPKVWEVLGSIGSASLFSAGLEDQMLGLVVTKEAPQLEERKAALAQSNADMRRELQDLQDKILQVMSQSQGNILDDEVLLNTLSASKQTSEEIQEKVQEAELTEREIDEARCALQLFPPSEDVIGYQHNPKQNSAYLLIFYSGSATEK